MCPGQVIAPYSEIRKVEYFEKIGQIGADSGLYLMTSEEFEETAMIVHKPRRTAANGLLTILGTSFLMMSMHTARAQTIERLTDLRFDTRGQSLFFDAGNVTRTESLRFDVLNEQNTQLQKGRIVNSQVPLSVATLQVIWQKAINACTSKGYTVPVAAVTINPSQSECQNGEIRRRYCVVPPKLGWSGCVNTLGNRKTYVRNLGPGIGPRPTRPARRPYDFGAIVTMHSDVRLGFEGSYSYDLGSVDIDYSAQARLQFDKNIADPGDLITISTSFSDQNPYVMTSRYPSFELALDMYSYARIALDADYAGVNDSTGDQVRSTRTLYSIDTRENPDAVDGFVPFTDGSERLFSVRLDSSGLTTTILGAQNTIETRYEYNMTFPFSSPDVPAKKAPRYKFPVSFSLADFAFTVPKLDTPAPFGFNCGDCVPTRNQVIDGALTNTSPVGRRQLIGGITDGNGIVLPFVNEGEQDVDLARVDVDLDVVTVAAGVPLGVVITDPAGVLDVELNLLDFDLATFISADQTLQFRPNLEVELRFSAPTEVRTPDETDFVEVTSRTINVGDSLIYRQPSAAVTVTPVYTVRNNEFSNLTQLKISSALQQTLGQVKLGGYIGDNLAEVLGEDPNFALLQLTPTLYDPTPIWSSGDSPWSLAGFTDFPGVPVTVPLTSSGGSSGGGVSGGGASSGGGGALGETALSGLLLMFAVSLRARRHRELRRRCAR